MELQRLVVHPDRLEQLSYGPFGLEVRRLFFDELSAATVHRRFATWVELVAAAGCALLGVVLVGIGLWQELLPMVFVGALALLTFVGLAVAAWLEPPHELVVWGGGRSLRTLLPRRDVRRERAILELKRAVESHQRRHARPPAPPAALPEPPPGP
jgi:hypothetical protein